MTALRRAAPAASLVALALLALVPDRARAQESPELPAKADTAAQPLTPGEIRFTKGKGPGRGNSFLLRYEEDYSYLRDPLALVNGFGEVYGISDEAKTGLRAGRQEIFFGNNLQVRANVSTNLPSPVFDGFRAYRDWGFARLDAFAYNVVNYVDGIF